MRTADEPGKTRYAIIADDLTGATDAGAAFSLAGFEVEVVLHSAALKSSAAPVIAMTTNSRHDSPAVARRKVVLACTAILGQNRRIIYKKIDSTVKGNVATEVDATRRAAGFQTALVCPANPAQGRIVQHGVLTVRGEIMDSLFTRFQAEGMADVGAVEIPLTPSGVRRVLGKGKSFIIADAVEHSDLKVLVNAALSFPGQVLLAGSAGMAAALAGSLQGGVAPGAGNNPPLAERNEFRRKAQGPTLVFSGSQNRVTHEQIVALVRNRAAGPFQLHSDSISSISSGLERGRTAIIQVPIHLEPDNSIRERLRLLEPLVAQRAAGSLLLTGGDTALLICRWLRMRAIALRGELLPGLAWGRVLGGRADGLVVCTKPGGFGDASSLVEATHKLSSPALTAGTE